MEPSSSSPSSLNYPTASSPGVYTPRHPDARHHGGDDLLGEVYVKEQEENLARVAVCNLNQWALDFDGNLRRIAKSIQEAKANGARLRVGPELEIPGYGCEDHFLELDTVNHSWEVLAELLSSDLTDGILCDIGIPALHRSLRYNCRVWVYNRRILLVRPKMVLADELNYRESRYFARWYASPGDELEEFKLPLCITHVTGQTTAPFGLAILECLNATVASEICEELWSPEPPHVSLYLHGGVDIICNGNGSHYEMRKLDRRFELLSQSTRNGGVYLYSNQIGCDGGRLYFDGASMICVNGSFVGIGKQFSLDEVEVITATIDISEVRCRRAASSTRGQVKLKALGKDAGKITYPVIQVPFSLSPPAYPSLLQALRNLHPPPALDSGQNAFHFHSSPPYYPESSSSLVHSSSCIHHLPETDYHKGGGEMQRKGTQRTLLDDEEEERGHEEKTNTTRQFFATPQRNTSNGEKKKKEEGHEGSENGYHDKSTMNEETKKKSNSSQDEDDSSRIVLPSCLPCTAILSPPVVPKLLTVEEEIALAPACWLWDYLRRSHAGGFFLPLSGGADSASVAVIAFFMCRIVMKNVREGNEQVISDVERILRKKRTLSDFPTDDKELCHALLHTCYMGSAQSSTNTRRLAASLANEIGSYHLAVDIDTITSAFIRVFSTIAGFIPRFRLFGGSYTEDLALQNIQARSRMVLGYFIAQLLPLVRNAGAGTGGGGRDSGGNGDDAGEKREQEEEERNRTRRSFRDQVDDGKEERMDDGAEDGDEEKKNQRNTSSFSYYQRKREERRKASSGGGGYLLVLGTANVDEGLRGYFTKYDASSADLNPIGSIAKLDLKAFLLWASRNANFGSTVLEEIVGMPPTAELRPADPEGGVQQTDEEEMGMTYEELGWFGRLRKLSRCGPVSMFRRLLDAWRERCYPPSVICQKVQHFFREYARNRHKMATITPAFHVEGYSPDDNRFDLRPFLYPDWGRQFAVMDRMVADYERNLNELKRYADERERERKERQREKEESLRQEERDEPLSGGIGGEGAGGEEL